MGLRDLQIIAFCFYLHFTKRPNFFGIELVFISSKCREDEVPPHLFYQPHVTKYGTVVTKAMAS